MTWYWFLLAVLALVLVYALLVRPWLPVVGLFRRGVRHSTFIPLVGDMPRLTKHIQRGDLLGANRFDLARFGPVFVRWFGPFPRLLIIDPEIMQEVLVKKNKFYNKPAQARRTLTNFVGNGILLSEGDVWKHQRQMINPAFRFDKLKTLVDIMVLCSHDHYNKLNAKLRASAPAPATADAGAPQTLEMHRLMSDLTLDIIVSCTMGARYADLPLEGFNLYEAFDASLRLLMQRTRRLIGLFPLTDRLPICGRPLLDQRRAALRAMLIRVVNNRQTGKTHSLSPGQDLLDMLLGARDEQGLPMDPTLLQDELMTFVLAGHETTSNLLTWTLYLLGENPQYLQRCADEVHKVFGAFPTEEKDHAAYLSRISVDSLKQLEFMECVFNESLRLYPPAPLVLREAVEAHELGPNKLPIPVGLTLVLDFLTMQRRKDLWGEDADEFVPDRWTKSDASRSLASFFLPFSLGPRACIGSNFARLEAKVALLLLLARFKLTRVPQKVLPLIAITLRPRDGLQMSLQPYA